MTKKSKAKSLIGKRVCLSNINKLEKPNKRYGKIKAVSEDYVIFQAFGCDENIIKHTDITSLTPATATEKSHTLKNGK